MFSCGQAEANSLSVHDIVLAKDDALLRCKRETCAHASAECFADSDDSGEMIHDNVGVGLVVDIVGVQEVVGTAQSLENQQFSFL